ncbi:MAG: alpha-1,6-glucosidase domain-containing protein, partial [Dokdonella sp.]
SASLSGDRSGSTYAYLVDVFAPGFGIVRNRVTDPYSISLVADSRRSAIASLDAPSMKPPGWDVDRAPRRLEAATDMMIYELHVRDFSINDATVSPPNRGKYLAFTETSSNGMRHLRALAEAGMTDLHLLPVFDIASIPESGCLVPTPSGAADSEAQQAMIAAVRERDCFNWGYDPWHYTAPEGSYASDAHDPAVRVREFRRMVQAVHGIGLRVGMDVVYNHTPASGQQRTSVLDRIVPGYYHRLDAEGRVERSTCCDNTATEHRMMAKLMIDSVIVWARDHHIDSFRFDLMGHQPRAVMIELQAAVNRAAGRHVELIGEGWNFGEVEDGVRFVQAAQGELNGTGIATFSDRARDAVRGGGCCDSGAVLVTRQGHVNGLSHDPNPLAAGIAMRKDLLRSADLVRVGLAGSLRDVELLTADDRVLPLHRIDYEGDPAGYASAPGEVVNYVENHDNSTLFDINVLKLPPTTSREDRARVQILALATTAFSQGVAYFHAGVDILRSKSLDRNSYNSGDWFNRLDWSYQDNHFGTGLPPAKDNAQSWAWLRPLLANAAIKPGPDEIAWTRDAFRDLLRIRASSRLFRLRTQAEVRERLRFHNTGSAQQPTVLAVTLDGSGLAEARFDEIAYFINVDRVAHDLTIASARAKSWQLHPLQRDTEAADARVRDEARVDAEAGRFHVPARTAVVFVVERKPIED